MAFVTSMFSPKFAWVQHLWTSAVVLCAASAILANVSAAQNPIPTLFDPDLQISLFASEPEIATPIGAVVDRQGRLFVVESWTHSRGQNTAGPSDDRVKVFEDLDTDGRPDRTGVFADGLRYALNLAFSREGELFVVQRNSVVVLHDRDGDGRSESRSTVLRLETANTNPHGVLLGIAFSPDNWMYVSLGNISGQSYAYVGTDERRLEGYGNSGNIVRSRPDGSQLEWVAVGFWNPFWLEFDGQRRLLCSDNDPDSRGPNRLLHVIHGGDYGFRSRFGNSGLHPYSAWAGELPGTLPMIAGLGEAPTAVLDCDRTALPIRYSGDILAAIWGTHEIGRVRVHPEGVSLQGKFEPLVKGDGNFRPVALAPSPDGSVYITDWVLRNYPVHGRGRIWRLSAKRGVETIRPRSPGAASRPFAGQRRLDNLRAATNVSEFPQLRSALKEKDPFVLSAAVTALGRPVYRERLLAEVESADTEIRLGAVLALRRVAIRDGEPIVRKLLQDSSPAVRKMALVWAGEAMLLSLAPEIHRAISFPETPANLFEIYLATKQLLTTEEAERVAKKVPGSSIKRSVDQDTVASILKDATKPSEVRTLALRFVDDPDPVFDLLAGFVEGAEDSLASEAMQTLSRSRRTEAAQLLRKMALASDRATALRCEALAALSGHDLGAIRPVAKLLNNPDRSIALATARLLRPFANDPGIREILVRRWQSLRLGPAEIKLREQLYFILAAGSSPATEKAAPTTKRPGNDAEWFAALARQRGDAEAGRRVFYHPAMACATCHAVRGRGGKIGPDLSNVANSMNTERIVRSILHPSEEISPEFQGYRVVLKNGEELAGIQFHYRGEAATLILSDSREVKFNLSDAASYGPTENSLMPEGLIDAMSVSEFQDLIAYLATLKQ
jgi:putative membrane-bound dehydrogenase-like protein